MPFSLWLSTFQVIVSVLPSGMDASSPLTSVRRRTGPLGARVAGLA